MVKTEVRTEKSYRTAGPYVQGIVVPASARTVYTSGVLGRDASDQLVDKSDMAAQSRQCLENIRLIIEAAGGSLQDLVKLTVFVSHPPDYEAMNAVRKENAGRDRLHEHGRGRPDDRPARGGRDGSGGRDRRGTGIRRVG